MMTPLRMFGTLVLAFAALHFGLHRCEAQASSPNSAAAALFSTTNTVRSITLPHYEPDLPVAPGRDEFMVVCGSCHSARYVTMQPLFPQRQWEETVDKMAKVYGAQMDQEQRQAIIGYLVAIHGPNAKVPAPAQDDDSDFSSSLKLPPPSETSPLLQPTAPGTTEHLAEVTHGAELFKQDCAACHGTTGRGDGLVGQVLLRPPKNLVATRFSTQLLSQVLWNGKRGTTMPSWRNLPQRDLTALAAFVQTLHQPPKAEPVSPESLQRGKQLFQQNCAPCHGVSGDGKGATAANLIPPPASFKLRQPDLDYILQVLRSGIPGTAMPSWKDQLSETDRQALAGFVRSLFEVGTHNADR